MSADKHVLSSRFESPARRFLRDACGSTLRAAVQSPEERDRWIDEEGEVLAGLFAEVAEERALELRELLRREPETFVPETQDAAA